ncbi:MAG: FAD-dependent oxidoreductase, partial [Clostridia bacterium]|nr:FAD-dependent oxidoreductase [Clostridia bacterium]
HISFHLEQTVIEAKSDGNRITSVILKSGKELPCDLLILAVGVRPETELAEKSGIEVNRGIITDPATMQTSDKNIYAAGDCAVSVDMLDGSRRVIALWPNAVNQGTVAGSQMAGGGLTIKGSYSVNAIDFYGLRICTCGLINAVGGKYSDKIIRSGDSYKRLIFEDGRLVGYVLINSSDNAGIYTSLIESKEELSALTGDICETPDPFIFPKDERKTRMKGALDL